MAFVHVLPRLLHSCWPCWRPCPAAVGGRATTCPGEGSPLLSAQWGALEQGRALGAACVVWPVVAVAAMRGRLGAGYGREPAAGVPHSRVLACCSKPAAVCGEWLGCSRCDLLAPGGSRTLPSIRRTHCSTSESGRGNSAEATRSSAHAACWIARARRQQDSSSAAKRCRAPDAGTWRMARSAGARAPIERMRVRCRDSDWDTCPIRAHRARYGTPSPDVLTRAIPHACSICVYPSAAPARVRIRKLALSR